MSKRVYISADYSADSGDRDVVDILNSWGKDAYHKVDFVDMAKVVSGSVSDDPDCRNCDLKQEFNAQINASSAVIFIVGDKTASRTAGSGCERAVKTQYECTCTPYKQNTNGKKHVKFLLRPKQNQMAIMAVLTLFHIYVMSLNRQKRRTRPLLLSITH